MKDGYFVSLLLLLLSTNASAFVGNIWNYFSRYQLGLEYAVSKDNVNLSYSMQRSGAVDLGCEEDINDTTKQICKNDILGGSSSGFGLFIQQPFRRTGDILLNLDLGFGVRYLNGTTKEEELINDQLPLQEASFKLLAFLVKPYVQIGYTPFSNFPDVILTFGPVIQSTIGQVSINEVKENVIIASASGIAGYVELEIVFVRFGDGAFSIYTSNDTSGKDSTDFYPKGIDGMSEFKGKFSRDIGGSAFGYGIKLVLNWP